MHFAGGTDQGGPQNCFSISVYKARFKAKKWDCFPKKEKGVFSEAQGQKSPKSQHPKSAIMLLSLHSSIYDVNPYLISRKHTTTSTRFSKTFIVATTLIYIFYCGTICTAQVKAESALLEGNPCSGDLYLSHKHLALALVIQKWNLPRCAKICKWTHELKEKPWLALFRILILNQHQGENITNEEHKLLPFLKKQNPVCVLDYVDTLIPNSLPHFPHTQVVAIS